ncbi:hypothetical protein C7S16_6464 [Burkholderia thailandensis]|uniref:Uncharacterized protein n=1 Tax=Burkholderia thailandensis TaxID=57975 RepID=A0AAW9CPQ5_BURTH|nr:hypothetical protein [Burkholderia thailandensis]MDW9250609.1 hypothetical protein [Burkholderia thailandensis]
MKMTDSKLTVGTRDQPGDEHASSSARDHAGASVRRSPPGDAAASSLPEPFRDGPHAQRPSRHRRIAP